MTRPCPATAGHLRSARRNRGFSLVELSVSLLVAGLIGVLIWRWTSMAQAPATRAAMQAELAEVQGAIEGFVLATSRLPCPAATSAGTEACGAANAVLLPWRTLGLPSAAGRLHYGANRGGGADLAALPGALAPVAPDLNLDVSGVPLADPPETSAAATEVARLIGVAQVQRSLVNGLDWCGVLGRLAVTAPATAGLLQAGNITAQMPVAYIVVHPGANTTFDGNNAVGAGGSWRYDLPGRVQDATFDDLSLAVGPSDLAARIGCVTSGAAARAAAQIAYAQYDTARVMQEYWSLRAFDIETAEGDVQDAKIGVAMAAMNAALALTSTTVGLASAANTEGLTAPAVVLAAASLVAAGVEVGLAAQDLIDAEAALVAARAKLAAANAYAQRTYQTLAANLAESIRLDAAGLNP